MRDVRGNTTSSPDGPVLKGPLLAAYGLWKRWRVVRLVLLGVSWWSGGVLLVGCGLALITWAGWIDGSWVPDDVPRWETAAIAATVSAFAAWQYWVLMRPAVRRSFGQFG
jgi:hypothetical protein